MIPSEAKNALLMLNEVLPDSLVAVYLHGSAVTDGLRPDSDVDLLVVVDQPLNPRSRTCLTSDLMNISGPPGSAHEPRPIELIIVLRETLAAGAYPVRYEFLYGEWLRSEFETGTVPEPAVDPDLTLVLAQARQTARPLVGPEVREILPEVPESEIRQAIADALPALLASLEGDERNVLLTLARMWFTASTGEFASKNVAAQWAVTHLSGDAAIVLSEACDAYFGVKADDWSTRRQDVQRTADLLHEHVLANL